MEKTGLSFFRLQLKLKLPSKRVKISLHRRSWVIFEDSNEQMSRKRSKHVQPSWISSY